MPPGRWKRSTLAKVAAVEGGDLCALVVAYPTSTDTTTVTATLHDAADSVAIDGAIAATAAIDATEAADAVALTGQFQLLATVAATEAADSAVVGAVSVKTAVVAALEQADAITMAGKNTARASIAATEAADGEAMAGAVVSLKTAQLQIPQWNDSVFIAGSNSQNNALSTLATNTVRNLGQFYNPDPRFNFTGNLSDGRFVNLDAHAIIDYSGTCYDSARRRIYLFGGGHGQSQETDVRCLDLATLQWLSLYQPTDPLLMNDGNFDGVNGRWVSTNQPTARHTASMNVVIGNRMYMMAWQGMPDHLGNTTVTWGGRPCWLDLNTLQWGFSQLDPGYDSYIAACLDPVSQKILITGEAKNAGADRLWVYDPVTDTLTSPIFTNVSMAYNNDLVYHPPSDTFYAFQSDGRVWRVVYNRTTPSASTVTVLTTTGTPPSNPLGIVCGFAYDPVNNLFGGNVTNGVIYLFDPTTLIWSTRTMQREDTASGVTIFQSFENIEYDTASNCYIFLGGQSASGNDTAVAWAYRYGTNTSPPPPPPPPPPLTSDAYRSTQPYLFTSIQAATIPNRISGGTAYDMDRVGVQYDYADTPSGWAWTNRGGDWVDRNSVKQGSTSWADVAITLGDTVTAVDWAADVTTALQVVRAGRWNAWIVRGTNAPLVMAGRFSTRPPAIDVRYTDGTTATLACRVSALLSSGSAQPSQSGVQYSLPMAVEFERPTKDVQSATLRFTITQKWSGSGVPHALWNLADPPPNTDPVTTGYAQSYLLDSGIEANANTIWVHRYTDGTLARDVILQLADGGNVNWFDRNFWSPHLWQTGGAIDTTKLPYRGAGKWVGATKSGSMNNDPNWNVVSSTYTGEGFVPLAPGIGAMRVRMPADTDVNGNPIVDGSEVGQNGTLGLNAKLFMPEADIGLLDHAFVRYYVFIAPYAPTLADKKQVLKLGVPTWTDMAGKGLLNLSHATPYGGNSGSCGGGLGWSVRHEFSDNVFDVNAPSPANGGIALNFSWYDFQYAGYDSAHPYGQPVGYTYGASEPEKLKAPGQRGGIGAELYFGRWYCIELEWLMNSVDTINPQDGRYWTPDGAMRMWIDNRLCYERVNAVVRVLPKVPLDATTQMPPIRKLGIAEVWFNWFHGGLTKNTIDRTIFVTGLVVGRNRIGPMKLT